MGDLRIISTEPDADIISILTDALDKALKGELTGVAISILTNSKGFYHEWAGQDIITLLGAVSVMAADMNEEARKL